MKGIGIPEDMKDKIFEWISRSKENGLGLYLVKTMVENYEGKIELRNVKVGGAAF